MPDDDVPSPIDFHDPLQCRAWAKDTVERRPYRPHFFAAFVDALNATRTAPLDVLELGSGPGHLAERILQSCFIRRYAALDFSAAMHELARARLTPFLDRVDFVQRDFRCSDWGAGLGRFAAMVTMQAAHETRHKRHLLAFMRAAKQQLIPSGVLLYCDHYAEEGSDKNPVLMATTEEQQRALKQAGFTNIRFLLDEGGMALYQAINVEDSM